MEGHGGTDDGFMSPHARDALLKVLEATVTVSDADISFMERVASEKESLSDICSALRAKISLGLSRAMHAVASVVHVEEPRTCPVKRTAALHQLASARRATQALLTNVPSSDQLASSRSRPSTSACESVDGALDRWWNHVNRFTGSPMRREHRQHHAANAAKTPSNVPAAVERDSLPLPSISGVDDSTSATLAVPCETKPWWARHGPAPEETEKKECLALEDWPGSDHLPPCQRCKLHERHALADLNSRQSSSAHDSLATVLPGIEAQSLKVLKKGRGRLPWSHLRHDDTTPLVSKARQAPSPDQDFLLPETLLPPPRTPRNQPYGVKRMSSHARWMSGRLDHEPVTHNALAFI